VARKNRNTAGSYERRDKRKNRNTAGSYERRDKRVDGRKVLFSFL